MSSLSEPSRSPENPDDRAVARLLDVLGGILIVFGGQPVVTAIVTNAPYRIGPAVVLCAVGVVILACGLFWHRLRPVSDGPFTISLRKLGSDARSLFVLLLIAGLYVATMNIVSEIKQNNEILALRNDVQSMANVIDRGVMPRHLNKRQQVAMSNFLLQFEPHEFAFQLPLRDEEAGSYRVDIEQALLKGGWTRSSQDPYEYKSTADIPEGLSINFIQTQ